MSTLAASDVLSAPLALHLFGPFEASVNGAPLPRLRSAKGQWLLALLALHANQAVERAWLTALLWPDSPERAAFANLRCSLKDLRRALGPEAARLRSPTTGTLCLDLTGAAVDVLAFDAAIARGDAASLREAAALYRGPLLERCSEEWVFLERRAREEAYLGALEQLAAAALAAGDAGEASGWLRRAVGIDPLRETAQRALMQALAADGNYGAALLVYRELRQRLHREINAEPDPETKVLFQKIRVAGREQAGSRRSGRPEQHAGAPDHKLPVPLLQAPLTRFVGREAELAEIRCRVDAALRGAGATLFLAGEPGIGKTRLATEAAIYAYRHGFQVLTGRCEEAGAIPFQPFVEAVREYLDRAGPAQIEETLPLPVAGELVRIVPQIASKVKDLPPLSPLPAEQARQVLLNAAVEFFAAIAVREMPLLLFLDDLHWADEGSLALLHALARCSKNRCLVIVGTYRDGELGVRHPLERALAAMNRERLYRRLSVPRLPVAEVAEMVASLLADPPAEFIAALHHETEGNPFFIEEVLNYLMEVGSICQKEGRWQIQPLAEFGVPPSIKAAIGQRLERLPKESRGALALAAVIGQQFEFEVLLHASGLEEQQLLEIVEGWLAAHLVVEQPVGRQAAYRFQHALIRAVPYDALSLRRRGRLHERVGMALEAVHQNPLGEHLEELAHHFAHAHSESGKEKGVDFCLRAGEKAANLYANEAAIQHLTAALELLDELPADEAHLWQRWGVVFHLQHAYTNCGAFDRTQEVLHDYLALAERAGCPWGAAAAHYWIAWSVSRPHLAAGIYYLESSHQFRIGHFEQSLRIAEQHGFVDWLARARAGIAYRLSLHGAELPRAEALLRATLEAPEGLAQHDLEWTHGLLMQICALQGKWDEVTDVLRQSIAFRPPGFGLLGMIYHLGTLGLIYCLGTMEEAHDRAGKQAEFVAFCEEAKALYARAGVPQPLHQWYLQPAVPAAAFRSLRFRDEFNTPELRPEWQWQNPTQTSAHSLGERPGHLTFHAGRAVTLPPRGNLSAPRITLELSADFALETKMAGDWDQRHEVGSGGLIIWKDALNFLHLAKFAMNSMHHGGIEWEAWTGGRYRHVGRGLLRGDTIYLRLERTGDCFVGLCSTDGVHWLTCGQMIFPVRDPIQVGVVVLNGMVVQFDYVKVLAPHGEPLLQRKRALPL